MQLLTRVQDWANTGAVVWTAEHGYLFPELETPEAGQSVLFVDYDNDPEDTLIQAIVEQQIDALGYLVGPRWVGSSATDPSAKVVSFVGVFPDAEVSAHLEKLKPIVPAEVLSCIRAATVPAS